MGIASLVCTVYVICVNYYYTKKLMPIVKIKYKFFDLQKIKKTISSGIWNSVNQLGNILSTGLDLFITNLFVGSGPMGMCLCLKLFLCMYNHCLLQYQVFFLHSLLLVLRKKIKWVWKAVGSSNEDNGTFCEHSNCNYYFLW